MAFVLEENEKIKISVFGTVLPSEEIGEEFEIPCRLALTDDKLVLYKFREDYFEDKGDITIVKIYQSWNINELCNNNIKMSRVTLCSKKLFIAIYTEFEKVSVVCKKEEYKACKQLKTALKGIKNFKFL